MLALSVAVWHEMQPAVFASTSSWDCPANTGGAGRGGGGTASLGFTDSTGADALPTEKTEKSSKQKMLATGIRIHGRKFLFFKWLVIFSARLKTENGLL
jgi:hypothetical protein